MEVTTTKVDLQVLRPKQGYKLCRKSVEEPYYSEVVYLGVGDSPDNYAEVSDEEVARIEAEHESQTSDEDIAK